MVYEKSYCNQPEIATQPKADGGGSGGLYSGTDGGGYVGVVREATEDKGKRGGCRGHLRQADQLYRQGDQLSPLLLCRNYRRR